MLRAIGAFSISQRLIVSIRTTWSPSRYDIGPHRPLSGQSCPSDSGSSSVGSGGTNDSQRTSSTFTSSPSQQSTDAGSSRTSSPAAVAPSLIAPYVARLTLQLTSHRARWEPKVRSELARLSSRWNTYSGYDLIEEAKQRVREAEEDLAALRQKQSQVRERYLAAVEQRATSQRTINDLLSRKSSWSDQDLIHYTSLLRAEHGESRAEEEARGKFDEAEREVARAWDTVVKRTLERYHDEQIWSDRVRNVSSYTQLAAVGLNRVLVVFIFLLAILLLEPYKRRKLAQTFESRLLKGEEQRRLALEDVITRFDQRVQDLSQGLEGLTKGQIDIMPSSGIRHGGGIVTVKEDDREAAEWSWDRETPGEGRPAIGPSADPLERVRREMRFLHSPRTESEREQRRFFGVAAAIGSVVGGMLVAVAFSAK